MEKSIPLSSHNDSDITHVKKMLLKLLNKPINNESLSQKEFDFIIDVIDMYPDILDEICFKPDKFYELMNKNENLATQIIFKLAKSNIIVGYLLMFVEKPCSINSLKVFNRLVQSIDLPSVYIKCYLGHIINEYKEELNLELKLRLGKLISFFILNLLELKHITVDIIPTSINIILDENDKNPDTIQLKKTFISSLRN